MPQWVPFEAYTGQRVLRGFGLTRTKRVFSSTPREDMGERLVVLCNF